MVEVGCVFLISFSLKGDYSLVNCLKLISLKIISLHTRMDWGQLFALLYIILGSPIRGGGRNKYVFKFKTRERVQAFENSSIFHRQEILRQDKSKVFRFDFKSLRQAYSLDYCYCSNFQEFSRDLLLPQPGNWQKLSESITGYSIRVALSSSKLKNKNTSSY